MANFYSAIEIAMYIEEENKGGGEEREKEREGEVEQWRGLNHINRINNSFCFYSERFCLGVSR